VYPTWVRSRRVAQFWAQSIIILAIAVVVAVFWLPGIAIALLAVPFIYISVVLSWSSRVLGPNGGDVQGRIHQLVIDSVGAGGRLLDVGCGSGQLLVRFAKQEADPDIDYVGLDFWGAEWSNYSKALAERNAKLEGIDNAQFVKGSASDLPFRDGEFGRVVSTLTFHEVRDVGDKTVGVAEALRVLAPGGRFAFVDLFDDPEFYGERANVLASIDRAGGVIESVQSVPELFGLHFPLTLGKVLKHAVAISGTKHS
jgi:SAM-dependent methyltransferase